MTLLLKQIFSLLKLLNSETGTNQIAMGISLGMVLGFLPLFSLQTIVLLFIVFFFRVQIGAFLVSSFFFAMPAYFFDSIFDQVGRMILESTFVNSFFTVLYNMPIIPYSRFNSSIVMGAFIVSMLIAPFVFIFSRILIIKYREQVVNRFKDTKIYKMIKATSLYKWYYKYNNLYG